MSNSRQVEDPRTVIGDAQPVDETLHFTGPNGVGFEVKKLRRRCWGLWRVNAQSDRMRFGDQQQIKQDVGYVLENGVLPPPVRRPAGAS